MKELGSAAVVPVDFVRSRYFNEMMAEFGTPKVVPIYSQALCRKILGHEPGLDGFDRGQEFCNALVRAAEPWRGAHALMF